jgi:V/A-type H+-transporting ATPase subunit I
VPALHGQVKGLASRRAAAKAAGEQAAERLAAIGAFAGHKVALPAEGSLRWTHAALWLLPARQAARIFELGLGPGPATLEQLGTLDGKTLVASVCLKEHRESVGAGLRGLGLEAIPPPTESTTLDAYVEALEAERRHSEAEFDACSAELTELGKLRVKVELVLGHWEERRQTALALAKMAATGRAAVLVGYVRERQLAELQAAVSRQLPQVSMVMEDPCAEDDVPVSLTCSRLVRPASFLVEMFGLPSYFQFDPSAFLMFSFVLFFGICLGDAIYAIVLFAMSWALIKRYRDYPGIRSLFELLAYGAVASFVVGVLTATWAADLFTNYVGQGNLLGRIVGGLRATDPLEKPLVALGIALFLGIANQFWGIGMRMYKCWRTGDKAGALFDGGFWLILLPGVVLLIAAFFAPGLPGWVSGVGAALAITGAIGLVLTQGRKEETLVGKIVVGVVSLYGIVGSYGTVAFIGDTLSYSRLLALGLTTAIVGSAVNIIAGMLNVDIAVVGVLLFIIVAVVGHFFNLLISGLGAFIHSARLIFVEFFGRFYEPGAQRFAPLGATGGRIRVVDR